MSLKARVIVSLRPGLGALLSSYLEGALYKFYRWIDRSIIVILVLRVHP